MKHIHQLLEIKVPYVSCNTADTSHEKFSKKEEGENNTEEEVNVGNKNTNAVESERMNDESKETASTCEETEEDSDINKDVLRMEEITNDIKSDLQNAISKGEDEMAKLKKKNTSTLKRLKSFDMEAMDELFEDSEDGDEGEKSDADEVSTRTVSSSSSLPYSSLTSRESVESADRPCNENAVEEMESEALRRHLQVFNLIHMYVHS